MGTPECRDTSAIRESYSRLAIAYQKRFLPSGNPVALAFLHEVATVARRFTRKHFAPTRLSTSHRICTTSATHLPYTTCITQFDANEISVTDTKGTERGLCINA